MVWLAGMVVALARFHIHQVNLMYRVPHKKQSAKKLNFSKTTQHILLCFSAFNVEVITYHNCEFYGSILSNNKIIIRFGEQR